MRFERILPFVGLAIALVAVCGCRAVTAPAETPLSSVAKEIQARGYRVQKKFLPEIRRLTKTLAASHE
jgi:hypothetical protein